ncbi:MAG TPA: HD domain-containing phosphohydrolase [Candidatus Limnocylindria bacterium]|nr:HD domain-containing phosphohydrolase [Candidatus Limnocylindria bacterium]
MTVPAKSAARDGTPAAAADQRLRETGAQVLLRFSSMVRIGRSYDMSNQVFTRQLDYFREVLTPLLEEHGEAVLVALEDDLFLNGVRVPFKSNNLRFHKSVLEEFKRRRIAGFRALKGLRDEEISIFFRLFLQSDTYQGTELLTACLAQGADHLLPAIHASAEAPDDSSEYDWPAWGAGASESAGAGATDPSTGGAATAGGHGGEEGGGTPGVVGNAPRGAARKSYSAALQGARSLLTTTSLQAGTELRHAKRVVQPLVDGAFASEPVVVGLSSLTHHDEYTYAHAVNVCMVAVSMGHYLEMDRRALADLGVAALLHDVGKDVVADQIRHPLGQFTPEEQVAAERHPAEGARLIAGSTTLNQTTLRCMRVALEHHMAADGSGYPALQGRWTASVLSRLVAVADCYVSLQTHRSARGATVTPYQALGMMLGSLKKQFDPAMLWALVQTVGFYPPGQMVELDDGSIALVVAPNAADLGRPHARIVVTAAGEHLAPHKILELRPVPPERSIRRVLSAEQYPTPPENRSAA